MARRTSGRDGAVRWLLPEGWALRPEATAAAGAAIRRRGRAAGAGPRLLPDDAGAARTASAIKSWLDVSEFTVADDAVVDVAAPTGRRRRAAAAVEVEVGPDEGAILLIEEDGLFRWKLPEGGTQEAVAGGKRSLGTPSALAPGAVPGPRTLRFELDAPAIDLAGPERKRGAVDLVRQLRARVLRFTVGHALGAVIDQLEGRLGEGVVLVNGPALKDWQVSEWIRTTRPLPRIAGVPGRRRVLLLVHGTFSSTWGSFGGLAACDEGRALLARACEAYDAVFGIDHRTLSLDPTANAALVADTIRFWTRDREVEVDAIAFSRGGLVLRGAIEQLAEHRRVIRWGKLVFVGCANGGTAMARRDNWHSLVDLYTSIAIATCRAASLALPTSAVPRLLSGGLRGVSALVKYLATHVLDEGGVPGLAAMAPEGDFVTRLRRRWLPRGASCHVVTSSFDTDLLGEGLEIQGIGRRLAGWLAEGFVRRLMQGAENDLVVDVPSMSSLGDAPIADRFDHGPQSQVFHTRYFTDPGTVRRLGAWLRLPGADEPVRVTPAPSAGVETKAAKRSSRPSRKTRAPKRDGDGARGFAVGAAAPGSTARGGTSKRRPSRGSSGRLPAPTAPGAPPPLAPPPAPPLIPAEPAATTTCHFAARMPGEIQVGRTAKVAVLLSSDAIELAAGPTASKTRVKVRRDRRLVVQVVPKRQLEVVGDDAAEVVPPAAGTPTELEFEVKGTHAGEGELWVRIRQGPTWLATLVLTPTIVAEATSGRTRRRAITRRAKTSEAPLAPRLVPELQIFERHNGSELRYHFVLSLPDGSRSSALSEPLRGDREAYVRATYKAIEERWISTDGDVEAFEGELRAIGMQMFEELVPPAIQASLWEVRDSLREIVVWAEEPFVPWEMVHLKPPPLPGGRPAPPPEETCFLAQMGLVRWLHNRPGPAMLIRLREGRAFHVVPDYPLEADKLPEAAEERSFLERRLRAQAAPASARDLQKFLRKGDFDLLHFACHGEAEHQSIAEARLLLEGRVETERGRRQWIPEQITATTVAGCFHRSSAGDNRPFVMLNACQAGRASWQLASMGGFAAAFLAGGAGAFVSSLWSVGDGAARTFSETLYTRLLAGDELSAAASKARDKARRAGEGTWLAYAVYGSPFLRLEAS